MKKSTSPNAALAANFRHLLATSPYKTAYALNEAVNKIKDKCNDNLALDEAEKILLNFPTGRTLYNLQNGSQIPRKGNLENIVDYYNHLNPSAKATTEEFLTIDLAEYYSHLCTCSKRERFTGLYSCYYLTVYDSHPVGALLYLDFRSIKFLSAVLVTEIGSDIILQDEDLSHLIQMSRDTDANLDLLKRTFSHYKKVSSDRERLQLMISSSVEITDNSLSIIFSHIDDPKKQISLGLNITGYVKHGTVYHGGLGIAFSNHNTVNRLAAFRIILASRDNLPFISLNTRELFEQLKHDAGNVLHVTEEMDAFTFRALFKHK